MRITRTGARALGLRDGEKEMRTKLTLGVLATRLNSRSEGQRRSSSGKTVAAAELDGARLENVHPVTQSCKGEHRSA